MSNRRTPSDSVITTWRGERRGKSRNSRMEISRRSRRRWKRFARKSLRNAVIDLPSPRTFGGFLPAVSRSPKKLSYLFNSPPVAFSILRSFSKHEPNWSAENEFRNLIQGCSAPQDTGTSVPKSASARRQREFREWAIPRTHTLSRRILRACALSSEKEKMCAGVLTNRPTTV